MPRFKLCDKETKDEDELKKCSDVELMSYIMKNLKLPKNPSTDSTHGIARFIVNTDGSISDVEILKEFIAKE